MKYVCNFLWQLFLNIKASWLDLLGMNINLLSRHCLFNKSGHIIKSEGQCNPILDTGISVGPSGSCYIKDCFGFFFSRFLGFFFGFFQIFRFSLGFKKFEFVCFFLLNSFILFFTDFFSSRYLGNCSDFFRLFRFFCIFFRFFIFLYFFWFFQSYF